ncbi:hypothetical protein N0V84_011136 [Fusarium piperis]|uniref:Uncharacterized protein n=1 Tax=Fusarium piperis TaxID=1435070 RepID=A0A9W8W397_9HYPO|nr:hypothetical protein N0V84_011136 [Fusarium piperis]
MDPKQASGDVDSNSEEDMQRLSDFSVLTRFIYDTSSFSDRLIQLATTDTTTEPASSLVAEADAADEKKDTESMGDSFYPEHLVIE